ncbi:MAG: DUF6503 family protein [Salibacteraceae bacterium]
MIKFFALFGMALVFNACAPEPPTAQSVVDNAIAYAGGEKYLNSIISFDFRDKSYSVMRKGGLYEMTRTSYVSPDSTIKDIVHNYGFKRALNDSMISVPDSMAQRYKASVNSVIYFFLLPYGLNDPSVNKKLLGEVEIKGKEYYKINVWFNEEGGGEDHDDEFIYWFQKDTYQLDYFAYSYKTDGGGMRFRVAYNQTVQNGVRYTDYINYKPSSVEVNLQSMDDAYVNGALTELSRIENDNVSISITDK